MKNLGWLVIIFLCVEFNVISSQQPRILLCVHKFPVLSETPIINLIKGLFEASIAVDIYAYKKGNSKKVHRDVYSYNMLEHTYFKDDTPDLSRYDIICCQYGPLGLKMLRQIEKLEKRPKLTVCFRGYDLSRYIRNKPKVYKKLFRQADLLFPVCEYFANKLQFLGASEDKIKVIHSAIDCDRFQFKERMINMQGEVQIVSVCRLVEKKGLEDSIRAMKEVIKKYPQCRYIIVGEGKLRMKLMLLIETLGLGDHVILVGAKTHEEIPAILNQSDVFILASTTSQSDGNQEGIPNAIKEAMAMGLPVISTFHAGIPELIKDTETGFLVQEKNPKEIAKKIVYILEHPEVLSPIKKLARKKIVNEYSIKSVTHKIKKCFEQIM